jgi:hypothetical protein
MSAELTVAAAYPYNEYSPRVHNMFTQGSGLRLMVAPSDLPLATEILNYRVSDEELEAEAAGTSPPASEL